jgi:hypothetical protein
MAVNEGNAINSYRDAMQALAQRLIAASMALLDLFQTGDPNDPACLAAITRETAAMRSIYLDALALSPPAIARGVQACTLRWFAAMVEVADDIDAGLADDDEARVLRGFKKAEAAGPLAADATRSAQRLAKKVELQNARPVWRRP